MSAALVATNLEVARSEAFRVRLPSLTLTTGELVAVIGPNGSGKSTLLRALVGLLPRTGGVTVLGADLASLSRREIAQRMAFLPQNMDSSAAFTVREVIEMGREPHRAPLRNLTEKDRWNVDQAMASCDLTSLADRLITELSGGECQRVFLARSFAQATPVLVLDEPTSHLDLAHAYGLLELVKERVRTCETAALVAIHDLALAAHFADRFLVLDGGEVVRSGTPKETINAEMLTQVFGVDAVVRWDDGCTVEVRGVAQRPPEKP
jgi:iron complex transport system ATP-binding protein